jgi:hypothetical protein
MTEKDIEVYPAGKCYCPSKKQEITENTCAGCSFYGGHHINNDGESPMFYIICLFS